MFWSILPAIKICDPFLDTLYIDRDRQRADNVSFVYMEGNIVLPLVKLGVFAVNGNMLAGCKWKCNFQSTPSCVFTAKSNPRPFPVLIEYYTNTTSFQELPEFLITNKDVGIRFSVHALWTCMYVFIYITRSLSCVNFIFENYLKYKCNVFVWFI